ncbi:15327_t:CDS:2 [Cetraspora pellucida]|uniref:15327_t:CDS:1 n=1 Tax=Cetraspora pellucida TaxID=1433469 RepID=A0A9N8VD51_9GLOM|nr:15327_t:CDS:2 [Cetraspora pellucida]
MQDKHTYKEADIKWFIKKDLVPEPYLYIILEPDEHFEYIVVKNDLSQRIGNKMEVPEIIRHQSLSEIVLEVLKKLKDGNKVVNSKADNSEVDEDNLNENKENKDEIDENVKVQSILSVPLLENDPQEKKNNYLIIGSLKLLDKSITENYLKKQKRKKKSSKPKSVQSYDLSEISTKGSCQNFLLAILYNLIASIEKNHIKVEEAICKSEKYLAYN